MSTNTSRPLPKDVQQAFHDVVFDFGVEKMAAMMSMREGTLYNKCNCSENEDNHNKPTGRDLVLATVLTGDKRIAQAFSHIAGGVHVDLPDMSNLTTDALLSHILKIQKEGGDFYRVIQASMAGDNTIDRKEFTTIKREAHEWIAAILESLLRMEEMTGGAK